MGFTLTLVCLFAVFSNVSKTETSKTETTDRRPRKHRPGKHRPRKINTDPEKGQNIVCVLTETETCTDLVCLFAVFSNVSKTETKTQILKRVKTLSVY